MERDIHTIDAKEQSLGRLSTRIATLLIGKHKPAFEKHLDVGDHVQIVNAGKLNLSQKKIDQKTYYRHSGFAKGLKEISRKRVWESDPSKVLFEAVSKMLPKNKHRNERLKRLKISN